MAAASAVAADPLELVWRGRVTSARVEAPDAPARFAPRAESVQPAEHSRGGEGMAPGSCRTRALFCYDGSENRLVLHGARDYMPHVEGLAAEGIALRRDRLVLRYSFR